MIPANVAPPITMNKIIITMLINAHTREAFK